MDGTVQIGLSDTIISDVVGIGVTRTQISRDDLLEARNLHTELCLGAKKNLNPNAILTEPGTQFTVRCVEDGKEIAYTGRTEQLTDELSQRLHSFSARMQQNFDRDSRALVKLDARVEGIEKKDNGLLVSVTFINSGQFPLKMKTPDQWDPSGGWSTQLTVGGSDIEKNHGWSVDLVGVPIINKAEYPEEFVTIAAPGRASFKFLVVPTQKINRGIYLMNLMVGTSITADEAIARRGKVLFHSDYKNPYRITFDRDYPSTPEEWKAFEARKAKQVSALPSGAMVADSGYYRMVSVFGPRSQFVTKLEAGKAAPKLDVNTWDKWEWEADLARATMCKPADACTRDGTWVLRRMEYVPKPTDETIASYTRRVRMGEAFPTPNVAETSKLYWEWLGA
ncbi:MULTISPECIES: hypothetical protein [unclassified Caballeronia]|uniref:hypothetical protein n=2 Tax=Caballeronia TaxID=1827195 RepID=UPI00202878AF|nr:MULTISPECIES: hypothetical protein [unclassified Caballeronia]MDR5763886.1 hypothetical protein [Caballeronia sp. LZ028]